MIEALEVVMKHRELPPTELSDEQRRGLGEPFAKALKRVMQLLDWHQRAAQADPGLNLLNLVDEANYALQQLRPNLPALLRRIPVLAPVVLTSFLATARVTSAEASIPVGAVDRTTLYVPDNSNPETEVQLAAVEQTSSELIVTGVVYVRIGPGTQYSRVDQLRPGDRIPLSQIKCRVYSGGLWWLEQTDGTWFAKVGSIVGNISSVPVKGVAVSQPANQEAPVATQRLTNTSNVDIPIVDLITGKTIGHLAPKQSTLVTGQSGYYYTLVSSGGIHIKNSVSLLDLSINSANPENQPSADTTGPYSQAIEGLINSFDLRQAAGEYISYLMSQGYSNLSNAPANRFVPPNGFTEGSKYFVVLYKTTGSVTDRGSYYEVAVVTSAGLNTTVRIPKTGLRVVLLSNQGYLGDGYMDYETYVTTTPIEALQQAGSSFGFSDTTLLVSN